jgi:hypothetical protein
VSEGAPVLSLTERQVLVATANLSRPEAGEYAASYAKYVALATEQDVVAALKTDLDETLSLLRGLPEATANTRHAPYTWSIKQVIGHLTDAERIFSTRALRFGRNDPTPVPSFEENSYVDNAAFDSVPFGDLLEEFEHLRRADIALFRNLPAEAWSRTGIASNNPVTVRALVYVILGHARHHMNIVRKRLAGAK